MPVTLSAYENGPWPLLGMADLRSSAGCMFKQASYRICKYYGMASMAHHFWESQEPALVSGEHQDKEPVKNIMINFEFPNSHCPGLLITWLL